MARKKSGDPGHIGFSFLVLTSTVRTIWCCNMHRDSKNHCMCARKGGRGTCRSREERDNLAVVLETFFLTMVATLRNQRSAHSRVCLLLVSPFNVHIRVRLEKIHIFLSLFLTTVFMYVQAVLTRLNSFCRALCSRHRCLDAKPKNEL